MREEGRGEVEEHDGYEELDEQEEQRQLGRAVQDGFVSFVSKVVRLDRTMIERKRTRRPSREYIAQLGAGTRRQGVHTTSAAVM